MFLRRGSSFTHDCLRSSTFKSDVGVLTRRRGFAPIRLRALSQVPSTVWVSVVPELVFSGYVHSLHVFLVVLFSVGVAFGCRASPVCTTGCPGTVWR